MDNLSMANELKNMELGETSSFITGGYDSIYIGGYKGNLNSLDDIISELLNNADEDVIYGGDDNGNEMEQEPFENNNDFLTIMNEADIDGGCGTCGGNKSVVDTHEDDSLVVDTHEDDGLVVDTHEDDGLVVDTHEDDSLVVDAHEDDEPVVDTYEDDSLVVDTHEDDRLVVSENNEVHGNSSNKKNNVKKTNYREVKQFIENYVNTIKNIT